MAKSTTISPCACGCGGTTKSVYCPGHDAQHKGRLVNRALELEKAAAVETLATHLSAEYQKILDYLDGRGWRKFLDKSRDARANTKRRAATSPGTSPRRPTSAMNALTRLAGMRQAYDRLAAVGRVRGDNRVLITHNNYQRIINSTNAELMAMPAADEQFKPGDRVWFTYKGKRVDAVLETVKGSRVRVEYHEKGKTEPEHRVLDVISIEPVTF